MAVKRLVILLNIDFCSSNSFLFGKELVARNGIKKVYIDTALPLPTKNFMKCTTTSWRTRDGSKLLGLLLENNQVCNYYCVDVLKEIFASSSYYIMELPTKGTFTKRNLIIPKYLGGNERIFCQEILVVGMRRNVEFSVVLKLPFQNNLGNKQTKEVKSSQLAKEPHWLNGLSRRKSVGKARRNPVLELIFQLLTSIVWFTKWVTDLGYVSVVQLYLAYISNFFLIAKQLLYRLNQINDIHVVINEKNNFGGANLNTRSISIGNKTLSVLIDIILGLIVVKYVFSNWDFSSISTWIIGHKYTVAEQLQNLLKWLMGVPAGLKLNKPLNQFLGNFYIYHVHLWTSYLYFIEAYLPNIIFICTLSGCLGITFLLSVLCDVMSLLTLHIYCFYIYAARLYNFEIHALFSLLRLFTGKKWNILRGRVDSVESDVDRLFIGTLLFTILLFLFPTIFLYYIVFTSLRLFMLLIQAVLFGVVALFNSFPFFGVWLYFMKPECLPGEITVDATTIDANSSFSHLDSAARMHFVRPESNLFVTIKLQCLPLGSLFKNCIYTVVEATYHEISGGAVIKKLLTGKLLSRNKS